MRILLIAPNQPGVDNVPEIRTLTSLHQTTVINGAVTEREVYDIAQRGNFDILHFGTHGSGGYIELSDGQQLDIDDLLQVVRVSGAKLVFFNSCHSGRLAAFLVAHGAPYAISTNTEIRDSDAWKMPLAFYEFIARQERGTGEVTLPQAFIQADSGDGMYSLHVSIPRLYTIAGIALQVEGMERRIEVMQRAMIYLAIADVVTVLVFVAFFFYML